MEQVPEVSNPAISEPEKVSRSDLNETPHLLNFCYLTMSSLRNYAEEYSLVIPEDASHSDVANIVFRHFNTIDVDETQVLSDFAAKLEKIRKRNKHGTETENSDRKRVRKPKKYEEEVDDTYSVAGIDDEEEYVDESVKAPSQDDESMYCFCQQKATEDMICCDNPKCPYKWFHYRCVGLTPDSITDGLWY
ncbi:hypothetical protein WA588_004210, partial [Blastocystis sp. NMH]